MTESTEWLMKSFRLDPRGHKITSDFYPMDTVRVHNSEIMQQLLEKHGTDLMVPFVADHLFSCAWCDEYPSLEYGPDGTSVRMKTDCSIPQGMTIISTFEVVTGKVIVTDELRPVFNGFDHPVVKHNYNSVLGQSEAVAGFAAQGCCFGPVGNSCPGLWRTGEGHYTIANPVYDDDDELSWPGFDRSPAPVQLASICTDLWAYSMADVSVYHGRGGTAAQIERFQKAGAIVDMPVGRYQVSHHTGEASFTDDYTRPRVYANIDLIN